MLLLVVGFAEFLATSHGLARITTHDHELYWGGRYHSENRTYMSVNTTLILYGTLAGAAAMLAASGCLIQGFIQGWKGNVWGCLLVDTVCLAIMLPDWCNWAMMPADSPTYLPDPLSWVRTHAQLHTCIRDWVAARGQLHAIARWPRPAMAGTTHDAMHCRGT